MQRRKFMALAAAAAGAASVCQAVPAVAAAPVSELAGLKVAWSGRDLLRMYLKQTLPKSYVRACFMVRGTPEALEAYLTHWETSDDFKQHIVRKARQSPDGQYEILVMAHDDDGVEKVLDYFKSQGVEVQGEPCLNQRPRSLNPYGDFYASPSGGC